MFKIRFVKTQDLSVFDSADVHWVPLMQRYETREEAEKEAEWLVLDDATYTYEVVPAAEGGE